MTDESVNVCVCGTTTTGKETAVCGRRDRKSCQFTGSCVCVSHERKPGWREKGDAHLIHPLLASPHASGDRHIVRVRECDTRNLTPASLEARHQEENNVCESLVTRRWKERMEKRHPASLDSRTQHRLMGEEDNGAQKKKKRNREWVLQKVDQDLDAKEKRSKSVTDCQRLVSQGSLSQTTTGMKFSYFSLVLGSQICVNEGLDMRCGVRVILVAFG